MIVQIAFLTGRSAVDNCSLSPIQSAFLARLKDEERLLVPLNFPYGARKVGFRKTPLFIASARNTFDYFLSRFSPFKVRYRQAVEQLLDQAPRTVFLAGSCGLEILVNLELSQDYLNRITVVAYGPVARSLPRCDCVTIQGRADWISNYYFTSSNYLVDAGHMNYLENGEVLDICNKVVNRVHCGIIN